LRTPYAEISRGVLSPVSVCASVALRLRVGQVAVEMVPPEEELEDEELLDELDDELDDEAPVLAAGVALSVLLLPPPHAARIAAAATRVARLMVCVMDIV
jgi:hypothetical protein